MENKKQQRVLEKVRALLAKTVENGASQEEAQNASAMAQKLMADYNIERDLVEISKGDISVTEVEDTIAFGENKYWVWELLRIVGEGYNCRVFRSGFPGNYFYKIVGFPEDRIVVKEIYEFLLPVIRNLWRQRWKEHQKQRKEEGRKPDYVGAFCMGYIEGFKYGLHQRLQEQRKEVYSIPEQAMKYELMIVKKDALLADYVDEVMKPTTVTTRQSGLSSSAIKKGVEDGRQQGTNKQLH